MSCVRISIPQPISTERTITMDYPNYTTEHQKGKHLTYQNFFACRAFSEKIQHYLAKLCNSSCKYSQNLRMISFNSLYYYNLSYPKNLLVDNLLKTKSQFAYINILIRLYYAAETSDRILSILFLIFPTAIPFITTKDNVTIKRILSNPRIKCFSNL